MIEIFGKARDREALRRGGRGAFGPTDCVSGVHRRQHVRLRRGQLRISAVAVFGGRRGLTASSQRERDCKNDFFHDTGRLTPNGARVLCHIETVARSVGAA